MRTARRWPAVGAIALAASIALGVASWMHFGAQRALSFKTGAQHDSGQLGTLLSARPTEDLPIHFSDGTILSMASASRARVTETSSHGATVVLEEGSIKAAVVHRDAAAGT